MKGSAKTRKQRSQKGFIVIATYLGLLFMLPLGLYAFEVARIQLVQNQLTAVTDAAALAGATYLSDPSTAALDSASALKNAKNHALQYVQRNVAANLSLSKAEQSDTVDTDNPKKGEAKFDLVYDSNKSVVTAKAVIGAEPLFGRFLGIGNVPVRAHSLAGTPGLKGDVIVICDLSLSMGFASKTVWVDRKLDPLSKSVTYKINKSLTTTRAGEQTLPAFPNARADVVPDPRLDPKDGGADFSKSVKMQSLANAPDDVQLAALVEAKAGHLENTTIYHSSGASTAGLDTYITPGPGFQDDYQRIALQATQPLSGAKAALGGFLDGVNGGHSNVHIGLVTFSNSVSRTNLNSPKDSYDSYSTRSNFQLPNVELSKDSTKIETAVAALGPSPVFSQTNIGGAIRSATAMLTGTGHRKSVSKTIILLTDGRPNEPDNNYISALKAATDAAADAGRNGVRIYAVGFFWTKYAQQKDPSLTSDAGLNAVAQDQSLGQEALTAIVDAANKAGSSGLGSRSFIAPDTPGLKNILDGISNGEVALVNEDN
jgi:hypothetical protein